MSGHGQHDHADDHAVHEHHDETTSDDFPPDEPRSPGWLPLLGGALLLAGIFGYVAFSSDDPNADGAVHVEPAPAAPPPAAQPGSVRRPAVVGPPGVLLPPARPRVPNE